MKCDGEVEMGIVEVRYYCGVVGDNKVPNHLNSSGLVVDPHSFFYVVP